MIKKIDDILYYLSFPYGRHLDGVISKVTIAAVGKKYYTVVAPERHYQPVQVFIETLISKPSKQGYETKYYVTEEALKDVLWIQANHEKIGRAVTYLKSIDQLKAVAALLDTWGLDPTKEKV